jgi:uncharacterized protein (TIGR02444 family)
MTDTPGARSPFWTFSLGLYGKPGVPQACLTAQDGSGVDVNVLLFTLFAARSGRRLEAADVKRLIDATAVWKDTVVVPLRHARRALKDPPASVDAAGAAALRDRVKAIELESERLEQEALYATFPIAAFGAPEAPASAVHINIATYAKALGVSFDAGAIATIIAAFNSLEDRQT